MSGGSQHNPNGRQSQLGSGWSPLQLQVANLLARAPQAHMASDRGVTWHTPTPPPPLYHVPPPSPPDPLQALKSASGNSVFRHTATPPELYRHTPTPPDKHLMRHTPSPGDMKASAALPPVDLYQHLAPSRADKLRAEELLGYSRVGVDLSLGATRAANGAATSPAAAPALSVRDAPTINSLIARAQPRHPHARVDSLLERLVPSPVSPHSVIVHSRAAPTPSPPSSNEDSADSCGAPPGSKRKRKPERTVRVAAAPPPPIIPIAPVIAPATIAPLAAPRVSPPPSPPPAPAPLPRENGDTLHNDVKTEGPDERPASPRPEQPHARRKTRSGSAETIDDIAAMIADTDSAPPAAPLLPPAPAAVSVDKLRSVLASPDAARPEPAPPAPEPAPASAPAPAVIPAAIPIAPPAPSTPPAAEPGPAAACEASAAPPPASAAAPRRRSARTSNPEAPNVPVESPSEGKPAEPEPAAASFVEVENQLEKMFAGLEEEPRSSPAPGASEAAAAPAAARKRRRSAPARSDRRTLAARKKAQRKKVDARRPRKGPREASTRDAYDSGSNASSSKSRGPYIQIRGPRDSPLSVSVMNTTTGEEEESGARRKAGEEFRGVRGARGVRGLAGGARRGLHASTLGLRYDASTPDASWLCAFCQRGPHAAELGDLFGPYTLDTDCDEYRSMDEATRRRYCSRSEGAENDEETADEVWFHEACGVWAPGLVAAGARLWGLAAAVWGARAARCGLCALPGAQLACGARACRARVHLPCARARPPPVPGVQAAPPAPPEPWLLREDTFCALCPRHA